MPQVDDLSRCLTALDQDSTVIAVIELSQKTWLVGGLVPGLTRQPLKKLEPDAPALLRLLHRWRDEANRSGKRIRRIAVAYEAGRDGFWLARWLHSHGLEAHVIHPTSVAVSREHRRAKTDRLDTELLKRAFLGWLRGEPRHCQMAAIPRLEEEDARRPGRERDGLVKERTRIVNRIASTLVRFGIRGFKPRLRQAACKLEALRTAEDTVLPPNTLAQLRRELARLGLVEQQIKEIEAGRAERVATAAAETKPVPDAAMMGLLMRIKSIGLDTADTLTHEAFCRPLRDERAVSRYGGLTGAPDESGSKRREQGLARAGNARVRKAMIQLAWRFARTQKDSALVRWYRARSEAAKTRRKTLIVALAHKLLIALWRYVNTGLLPEGVALRALP
jgi:transposase